MSRGINGRHHIVPSSRGGPDAQWNLCYFRIDKKTVKACKNLPPKMFHRVTPAAHHALLGGKTYIDPTTLFLDGIELDIHIFLHTACFHSIFQNALPSEQIKMIQTKYTNKDGSLNKRHFPELRAQKRMMAWIAIFGEESVYNTRIAIDFIEKYFMPVETRWRENQRLRTKQQT